MTNKVCTPMKHAKPQRADVTARLNALVDDLADLAADLHLEGKLELRLPTRTDHDSTGSEPPSRGRARSRLR